MADDKAYEEDEVGHTFQLIFCVRLTLSHPGVNSPTPPQLEAQAGNEEAKGAWRRKTPERSEKTSEHPCPRGDTEQPGTPISKKITEYRPSILDLLAYLDELFGPYDFVDSGLRQTELPPPPPQAPPPTVEELVVGTNTSAAELELVVNGLMRIAGALASAVRVR